MSKSLFARFSFLTACALAWAGCTVKSTDTPELSGPSDFALSFAITATPDAISQDGDSQSTIVVKAYGPNGDAASGVSFRLDMSVNGTAVDYGTLSSKTVVTGSDGRATAKYTSPAALPFGSNLPNCAPTRFDQPLPGGCIEVIATPVGSNYNASRSQTVSIHLVPLGVITPPALTPSASFTFNPSAPGANSPVQFDASASCPGQPTTNGCVGNSGTITNYSWEFGDGGTSSGRIASHAYSLAQTYSVTLTVTNDRGVKASTTKTVPVGSGAAPTAAFVFSPTPVLIRTQVYFDASNSRAGAGHNLVSYTWNWGDGDPIVTDSSPLQQHDFLSAGSYTVLLKVTDESGQIGTTTQSVTVAAGGPGAAFTMNPSPATVNSPVTFDGLTSTSTGAIVRYEWNFDTTNLDLAPSPIVSINAPTTTIAHTYHSAHSYVVTLTVYDANGLTGSATHTLLVQ